MFVSCFLASDHAGYALCQTLFEHCQQLGLEASMQGATSSDVAYDYPLAAEMVANRVVQGVCGILLCGSGIGACMAVNRHKAIRGALCHDVTSARLARAHNNANVLVLGARLIGEQVAKDCVTTFLQTAFEGGRHEQRLALFS